MKMVRTLAVAPDATKLKKLREEISALMAHIDENYVEVASRLWQVKAEFDKCAGHEQANKLLGYDSMRQWLEDVIGERGRRRAFYYLSIWKTLHEQAGVDAKELREIGWTKAKEITRVAHVESSKAKIKAWINKAKTMPMHELVTAVDMSLAAAAKDGAMIALPERLHGLRFALFDGQHAVVTRAIDLVMSTGGATAPGEAIAKISQDFLGTHGGRVAAQREDLLGFLLAHVEESWDIKLLALDVKTKKVRYGTDVLTWAEAEKKE